MIAASCGESLAYIWLTNQRIHYEKLSNLKGITLTEALSLIKAQRADWYRHIQIYIKSKMSKGN